MNTLIGNPKAYATPLLEQQHAHLVKLARRDGRLSQERRAALWRIENELNRRDIDARASLPLAA